MKFRNQLELRFEEYETSLLLTTPTNTVVLQSELRRTIKKQIIY